MWMELGSSTRGDSAWIQFNEVPSTMNRTVRSDVASTGVVFPLAPFNRLNLMREPLIITIVLALLLGAVALWMAERQWGGYERQARQHEVSGLRKTADLSEGILSLQEILQRLKLSEDTRILEVEREHHDGNMYYEIELVNAEGRIFELLIDPHTAEVVKQEEEED
jgi:uncharacterized membrane protein YkoI